MNCVTLNIITYILFIFSIDKNAKVLQNFKNNYQIDN